MGSFTDKFDVPIGNLIHQHEFADRTKMVDQCDAENDAGSRLEVGIEILLKRLVVVAHRETAVVGGQERIVEYVFSFADALDIGTGDKRHIIDLAAIISEGLSVFAELYSDAAGLNA